MRNGTQQLSIGEKVGYSLGDSAANFIFQTVIMFLMFFYTDVFGIPAAVAGTLFLITRIWDAVNDPMMGAIADRTKTRWGKFRPWVLITAIPFGLVGVLTFTTPDMSTLHKIIYAFITYNLLMMVYTANNIPYSALMGVLTGDSIERTGLASYRFVFAMLATLAIQTLTIPLVDRLGVDTRSTVVQSNISGDLLTITPKNHGSTKIIVSANDQHDHITKSDFFVKVTKPEPERPLLRMPLPDLTLEQGFGQYVIDLTPVFNPGKYGPLTYKAALQEKDIAKAEIMENSLKLIEEGIGVTNVTVTASDRLKSAVNSQFTLAVMVKGNSAPVVESKPDIDLNKGFGTYQLNLSDLFSDADGDALVYTATSSDQGVVGAEIEGQQLVVVEREPGQTEINVSANDKKGGMCSLTIPVMVRSGENMAPAISQSFSSKTISADGQAVQINLSKHFDDPDKDTLSYKVSVVNQAKGYQLAMGIFCALAVVFFFITFFVTKERVQPDPKQKTSLKRDLADLMKNGPWKAIFFLTIFIFIYLSLRYSVTLYYFTYYVKREDLFSWFNMSGMLVTIGGIFLSKPLALRFGKRNTFGVCLFLTAVFTTIFAFLPPSALFLIFATQILISLCYAPTIPMLWAMMADCADYSEWKTGRRATGMTFSAATFGLKFGLALGGFISGWLLTLFGYVAGAEQTPIALRGIRLMVSIIPAIPFFVGVIVLFFYRINKGTELQMQEELVERRKTYGLDSPAAGGTQS
jgi:Na+/melibiose symporter-like transporter